MVQRQDGRKSCYMPGQLKQEWARALLKLVQKKVVHKREFFPLTSDKEYSYWRATRGAECRPSVWGSPVLGYGTILSSLPEDNLKAPSMTWYRRGEKYLKKIVRCGWTESEFWKTTLEQFTQSTIIHDLRTLRMNGEEIGWKTEVKHLGIMLDKCNRLVDHIVH